MARANLEALIERVKSLTGIDEEFSADEIQSALDAARTDHRDLALAPDDSPATVWYAYTDCWESGYSLTDGTDPVAQATSGDVSEPLLGRFVVAAERSGPVYITGRTYDVYAAAAELLRAWAAKAAKDFDFSADGQSFSRSQKRDGLLELAKEYAKRAKPRTGSLVRPDEEG